MKIYESDIIQKWDQFTIKYEPVSSLELMERAAGQYASWFKEHEADQSIPVHIFCGSGNNGGDGLVIARHLAEDGYSVKVVLCKLGNYSDDNLKNQERLPSSVEKVEIGEGTDFELPGTAGIAIDAIFGVGLNRPVEGSWAKLIKNINQFRKVYAVDIPSGLFAEPRKVKIAVKATRTLTFQVPKLSFFFPEFEAYTGRWEICDIGLLAEFRKNQKSSYEYLELSDVRELVKHRKTFSHKGDFGHALLIAGSVGKVGAAILSAEACLRSGAGLLSIHAPKCAYSILQTKVPEAMVQPDINENYVAELPKDLSKYAAIGIGPGLDKREKTQELVRRLLNKLPCPIVIDADALNIIANEPKLLEKLTPDTVITPHPGEFDRLFGPHNYSWDRLEKAVQMAKELNITIILKGAYTATVNMNGQVFFNSSGNSGLASGGTGDTLTGIVLALLAQDYEPDKAARLAVFLHGLAADLALEKESCESMIASDIITYLGKAFKKIENC